MRQNGVEFFVATKCVVCGVRNKTWKLGKFSHKINTKSPCAYNSHKFLRENRFCVIFLCRECLYDYFERTS